ncbi:hypothetical protein A8L34_23810 [Bacillus sp. FJAT-27264]|uniref:aspartyl-phosphate phosphatase Spo0E family protein n=1 Tax=Paenibacillus sp. (strain DSM 101736 / FJAT-27264) TaxID=1850362 RepID=UPI000807BD48|nr:aspartyl-phosphate phosphatase Spo0E family protein [Bacillus sp. FJAT-27264]OBZ08343.1 hypothetical protein A8L34_23810 [Bacillus sp. FJAT-27264]
MNKLDFQDKIELLRGELHDLADRSGITSGVVLLKSQELDKLLNEYSLMLGFDVQRLNTWKYESEDTIKKFIDDGSKSQIDQYDKFLEVIQAKSGIYSIREGINRNTIIQSVLLSIVMASVATNMAPNTKVFFTEKIERVAQDLGINFDDIIYFTRYESKFFEILES